MIQAIRKAPRAIRRDVPTPAQPTSRKRSVLAAGARRVAEQGNSLPQEANSKRRRQIRHLKAVRERIEDLILLNDRQFCQQLVGGLTAADKARFRAESQRLVADLRRLVGANRPATQEADLDKLPAGQRTDTAKSTQVRIRLSSSVVRILQAFGKTGKRPGQMIERALWKDADIRDAALLLRIEPPAMAKVREVSIPG